MIKVLTIVGFIAQVLLGNLCMMPMAYAMDVPMSQAEHMEMVMTPVVPMSTLHCDNCIAVQEKSGELQKRGCSGHCFVQAKSTAVSFASSSAPVITATVHSAMIPVSEETILRIGSLAMGPSIVLHIDTTVLRL